MGKLHHSQIRGNVPTLVNITKNHGQNQKKGGPMSLVEYRSWDSDFFEIPIGQYSKSTVTTEEAERIDHGLTDRLHCVYAFIDPSDHESLAVAAQRRWQLIHIRTVLTLDEEVWRAQNKKDMLPWQVLEVSRDVYVEQAKEIAHRLSAVSRFHADPRFRERAERMYKIWFENILRGERARIIYVIVENHVAGIVGVEACGERGKLVLVARHPDFPKQGVGWSVVNGAIQWLRQQGNVKTIEVATQFDNISAMRHYERVGFRTSKARLVYHIWHDR
jgi:GNAT superfamily N-acetyltransferase